MTRARYQSWTPDSIAQVANVCRQSYSPAMFEPRGPQRGRPLTVAELLDVDVTAAGSGEEDRRVDPRGHGVESV
jgi:hypothetical protein